MNQTSNGRKRTNQIVLAVAASALIAVALVSFAIANDKNTGTNSVFGGVSIFNMNAAQFILTALGITCEIFAISIVSNLLSSIKAKKQGGNNGFTPSGAITSSTTKYGGS